MESKVALVTGAGVRLGQAIAYRLHQAGYELILHLHRSASELPGRIVRGDLSDRAAVQRVVESVDRLDLLVNNAAMFHPGGLENALADWDRFRALNLEAPLALSVGLAGHLRASRGAIVNIADIYGELPLKGHLSYCLSKAGIVMLTRSLALELAPEVRVNAVAPGAALPPATADASYEEQLKKRIPLQRIGGAEAIAEAVLYLAQSDYVTGQVLRVDGGRTLL